MYQYVNHESLKSRKWWVWIKLMNEWMNEKLLFILKSKIALSINPTGYYFLIKIFSLYNFKKLKTCTNKRWIHRSNFNNRLALMPLEWQNAVGCPRKLILAGETSSYLLNNVILSKTKIYFSLKIWSLVLYLYQFILQIFRSFHGLRYWISCSVLFNNVWLHE